MRQAAVLPVVAFAAVPLLVSCGAPAPQADAPSGLSPSGGGSYAPADGASRPDTGGSASSGTRAADNTRGEKTPRDNTSDSGVPQRVTVPSCQAHNLHAAITGSDSGAGTTMVTVSLTNEATVCQLTGFPGVSYVDAQGRQVGAAAARDASSPVVAVVVRHGETAAFRIRASQPLAYDPHHCDPVRTVAAWKIYPPNDTGWLTIPTSGVACANPGVTTLSVGTVFST